MERTLCRSVYKAGQLHCYFKSHFTCKCPNIKSGEKQGVRTARVGMLSSLSWHLLYPWRFVEWLSHSLLFLPLTNLVLAKGHISSQLHKQLVMELTGFSSLSASISQGGLPCTSGQFLFLSESPLLDVLEFSFLWDEMHMRFLHLFLHLFLHYISLLLPTGSGGNPNSGSGFQSGVWILASCQRRYASSTMSVTDEEKRSSLSLSSSTVVPFSSVLLFNEVFQTACVLLVLALTPSWGVM